jgi:hypothetical protein
MKKIFTAILMCLMAISMNATSNHGNGANSHEPWLTQGHCPGLTSFAHTGRLGNINLIPRALPRAAPSGRVLGNRYVGC